MAFRKLVGSYKDYNLSTHILEDGYLAVDVDSGSLRLGDGSTAGGIEVSAGGGGGSSTSLGDLTAVGSTLSAPSDADLILTTAGAGNINISNAYTLPSSDGSANQVLQTNGSGVLSFATVSGGSGSLDGGTAASTYGGITAIDGGTAE